MSRLDNARILVLGGAGFLGSHIVDQLTETSAAKITVLDNFVRGTRANLAAAAADPLRALDAPVASKHEEG